MEIHIFLNQTTVGADYRLSQTMNSKSLEIEQVNFFLGVKLCLSPVYGCDKVISCQGNQEYLLLRKKLNSSTEDTS